MRKHLLILCLLFIVLLLSGCKSPQNTTSKTIISEKGKIVTLPDNRTKLPIGDKDIQVPLFHSQAMNKALTEKGVEVTFHIIEGYGHNFGNVEICYQHVRDFLNKYLD